MGDFLVRRFCYPLTLSLQRGISYATANSALGSLNLGLLNPTKQEQITNGLVMIQKPSPNSLTIGIVGTDTSVGKTHITSLLTGLRQLDHHVWIHKPACGDWQE